MLDTGIWPESESFDDGGLAPVPAKWKGICQNGEMFNSSHYNKKIIGARYFFKGYEATYGKLNKDEIKSTRDTNCASTATGLEVGGVSFNGFANETTIGMAPQARLAMYKVSWGKRGAINNNNDVVAIEMALSNGMDIISMLIGRPKIHFYNDFITIGAFKAMTKGVLFSSSANNDGPILSSVGNMALWILTVGANSVDKKFPAPVRLGNREIYSGSSLSQDAQVVQ